jgi:hypothetical protein
MKSFYCRYNQNKIFPFTEGETYHAIMQQGNGFIVYDDKGNKRFLIDEPTTKIIVGHRINRVTGKEYPLYAEFEVF